MQILKILLSIFFTADCGLSAGGHHQAFLDQSAPLFAGGSSRHGSRIVAGIYRPESLADLKASELV